MLIVDNNTVSMVAQYTEPTTQTDGSPLTDLHHTNVYHQVVGSPFIKSVDIPATSPNGGGVINSLILANVALGQKINVVAWITATDTVGVESPVSLVLNEVIDRLVVTHFGPSAPTNFTLA